MGTGAALARHGGVSYAFRATRTRIDSILSAGPNEIPCEEERWRLR